MFNKFNFVQIIKDFAAKTCVYHNLKGTFLEL